MCLAYKTVSNCKRTHEKGSFTKIVNKVWFASITQMTLQDTSSLLMRHFSLYYSNVA